MSIRSSKRAGLSYGFSTIGCPEISFAGLISLAQEFKMDFVELRALGGQLDLPGYFVAQPLPDDFSSPVPVRVVATNLQLSRATEPDIDEFLRFVDVAIQLGAPYVRVFGGGPWGDPLSASQWRHAARTVEDCRQRIREKSAFCSLLLETHSSFSSSAMCVKLNRLLDEPLAILWDSHHTWRSAGETPAETWDAFGPLVRHIHCSDSQSRPAPDNGYDCLLPGAGEYPMTLLRELLAEVNYAHGLSLEWEKLWHPELPGIRSALREFQRLFLQPFAPHSVANGHDDLMPFPRTGILK